MPPVATSIAMRHCTRAISTSINFSTRSFHPKQPTRPNFTACPTTQRSHRIQRADLARAFTRRTTCPNAIRPFSASPSRTYKTVQEARSRHRSGPFSWKAGGLFVLTAVGLVFYFNYEKERMQRERIANQNKGIGKPMVGGPFEMIDHDGNRFTLENLKGKYSLVYFGFTHCPDICPDELDKMAKMLDLVRGKKGNVLQAVFVSADPARDTPEVVKHYLAEFHADFIGLTGTYDNVKDMCKTYRVYFSTPSNVKPGQDYLVDHSIYFYLMDPDGDFVQVLGRQHSAEDGAKIITDYINDWKGKINKN